MNTISRMREDGLWDERGLLREIEIIVFLNQRNSFWVRHPLLRRGLGRLLVELRKRLSPIEKGVSSYRREAFLASKKRPLYLQTAVFTPLSIRRGGGGEAVDGMGERLFFAMS